jgi:putative flippase GtrA
MRSLRMPDGSRPGVARQFGRFACVGASNTVVSYAVYAVLIAVGVPYLAAGVAAFAAGAVNGYRLNRRWTFGSADTVVRRVRYVVVQAASLGTTIALLWLVVSVGVHSLVGYALTIPAVTVASFLANRVWTFAGESRRTPTSSRKETAMVHERRISRRDPRRILVVANETVTSSVLHEAITTRAENVPARYSSWRRR